MDSNIPISAPMRPVGFPAMGQPPMGQPAMGQPPMGQPMMGQPPMGQPFNQIVPPPGAMRPTNIAAPHPYMNALEINQKANEFSRGVYVSGFQRTLTAAMLQEHFKIKPIAGLRLPLTKHNENKGFAFIYYNNADDATYVKQQLDYTVILRNKIRVTKTVIAENLSKMMFKLKKNSIPPAELKKIKEEFFNEKRLETQVNAIIGPIFTNVVQVNKIIIPRSKLDKQTLDYARGFFYISDIKKATSTANLLAKGQTRKDQYEAVLSAIADKLNSHETFSKYVKAQIYEYANKNKANVLHIKNLTLRPNEDPAKVSQQLRNLVQEHKKQLTIKGCFVAPYEKQSAWANIIFKDYEQTIEAYNYFKNNKVKFRQCYIYANIRNVKDLRTVVVSTVHPDTTEQQMSEFLRKLAQQSPRVDPENQSKGRKYDFASFNIIEQKTFYLNNAHKNVGLKKEQKPEESWRVINTVPRRVVIHFWNQIHQKELRQFINDIKIKAGWDKIFFEKDRKTTTMATHQKGHVERDGNYVKHADLHKKRNQNPSQQNKPPRVQNKRVMDQQQFNINKHKNVPKINQNKPMNQMPQRPPHAPIPNRLSGQIGAMPMMGNPMNIKMGQMPVPTTSMPMPQMGMNKSPGGIPPMGMGIPPMGMPPMGMPTMPSMGMPTMPSMGMPPPMGGMAPPMGGMPPPMGMPKMGIPPPNMQPPEKKQ